MNDTAPTPRLGLVQLTSAAVLWGTIGIVVRLLQDTGMSTGAITFWRLLCATVVLIVVLRRSGLRPLGAHLRRPGRLVWVSLSALAFQFLYFLSVRDVGAGVATLVTLGIAPVVLYVVEAVIARALPPPRTLAILVLALAGLALVSLGAHGGRIAPHPTLGLLEALGSGLAYALSTLWSRPLTTRLSPFAITLATSAAGTVLLLPVVALTAWQPPRAVPVLAGILWLGVVTSCVAYALFYSGLRSTPGSTAMIATLMEAVTAVILAALVLDEPFTLSKVLGGGLLLIAVAALYVRPRAP